MAAVRRGKRNDFAISARAGASVNIRPYAVIAAECVGAPETAGPSGRSGTRRARSFEERIESRGQAGKKYIFWRWDKFDYYLIEIIK
jgi:hypothetical protein